MVWQLFSGRGLHRWFYRSQRGWRISHDRDRKRHSRPSFGSEACVVEPLETRQLLAVDLSLADDIAGLAGETVTVPLFVQVSAGESAKSFSGFDFVVEYDPAVLNFNSAAVTSFTSGFTLTPNTSIGSGLLVVSGYTAGATSPIDSTSGSQPLANLSFTINATASLGSTVVNLRPSSGGVLTSLFDADANELILDPAPTNAATDTVDGTVTILAIVESEGNVVLSKRDGVGLYANGMPITYDTDGADGTPPTQLTKYFGLWDAIEAERLPGFAGDENTLFFKNTEGTVYCVPADDTWRLYGADRVRNAFSIPLLDPTASPLSSAATTPVEVTGHVQLRQTFAGELVADGLRLIRNDLPVSRRTEISGAAAVYVAAAAEFYELDGNSLRLLWWNGVDSLREWRFTRDTNAWLFASESLISAEDADLAFGVSLQNIVIAS